MTKDKRIQTIKFIAADWLAAALAWGLFYIYRKLFIESHDFTITTVDFNKQFLYGIILLPLSWITLYAIVGAYKNVYRKSRLREVGQTLWLSILGVLIIFFALLLDDTVINYRTYYRTFFTLFSLHFFITVTIRLILSTQIIHRLRRGDIGFNTIIIGSNKRAVSLLEQMRNEFEPQGNRFVGFVHVEGNNDHLLMNKLPHLGTIYNLPDIIEKKNIEEAIIAIESSEHDRIGPILNELEDIPVLVKIIPDIYDILSGSVKMNSIYGAPLIEISPELMPAWQQSVKRLMDIVLSLFVFVFFSPVYVFTAIGVLMSSRGPLLYSHERIGLHGSHSGFINSGLCM
jgi:FlaA1/EpsC-like NDP-sugar epimerase